MRLKVTGLPRFTLAVRTVRKVDQCGNVLIVVSGPASRTSGVRRVVGLVLPNPNNLLRRDNRQRPDTQILMGRHHLRLL